MPIRPGWPWVLRDMIRGEYARHPRVIRLEVSADGGTTDLVLREL